MHRDGAFERKGLRGPPPKPKNKSSPACHLRMAFNVVQSLFKSTGEVSSTKNSSSKPEEQTDCNYRYTVLKSPPITISSDPTELVFTAVLMFSMLNTWNVLRFTMKDNALH